MLNMILYSIAIAAAGFMINLYTERKKHTKKEFLRKMLANFLIGVAAITITLL